MDPLECDPVDETAEQNLVARGHHNLTVGPGIIE
jgi:hypothetical protein